MIDSKFPAPSTPCTQELWDFPGQTTQWSMLANDSLFRLAYGKLGSGTPEKQWGGLNRPEVERPSYGIEDF